MARAVATSAAPTPVMPSRWTSASGDPGVERQAGQDGRLRRGVVSLDVGRGVGLRVTELLRLGQRLGEAGAALVHPGEDEVRGAVDDPEHPQDGVAGERLAQRAQQRDGAGDAGLVVEVGAGRVGRGVQLRTVLGEQGLVRGDHRGAAAQGPAQQRPGRLDPAHDLDDDVDVRPVDQAVEVLGEQLGGQARPALRAGVADADPDQLDRRADPGGEVLGLGEEQPDHLRADDAAAQQRHPQWLPAHRLLRSSRCAAAWWCPSARVAGRGWPGYRPVPTGPSSESPTSSSRSRSSTVSRRMTTRAAPSRTATTGGRPSRL